MKRRIALFSVAVILALAGISLAVLRTDWMGRRLCAELADQVGAAAGQPFVAASCRVEPLALALEVREIRLGPESAPLFAADAVRVRLAPLQALGGVLELAEVRVERPRVAVSVPASDPRRPPAACPPEAMAKVRVGRLTVQDGSLDLRLPGGQRVQVARLAVRAAPITLARGLRALATRAPREGLTLEADGIEAQLGGRPVRLDAVRADVDLALDLSRLDIAGLSLQGGEARLDVSGAVENLCRPTLALRVQARTPLRTLLDALGKSEVAAAGTVGADLRVTGKAQAPGVAGEVVLQGVSLEGYRPGDARLQLELAGAELAIPRLEVVASGGSVVAQARLHLGKEIGLEAQARLEGTELGDVFSRLGLPGAWVSTRVRGEVRASGTVAPLQLAGTASLDLADFRVRDRAWDAPPDSRGPLLEFRGARLETRVAVTPEKVHLEDAKLKAGSEELTVQADLFLAAARGFAIDLAGSADLGELRHVASVPLAGRAVLVGHLEAAPYGNPRVQAQVRVRDLHLLDLDLGEAGAEIAYPGGASNLLQATAIEGRRGATRYGGEIAVDLGAAPATLSGRFEAVGQLRDLFDAALPRLPAVRSARDVLDASVQASARLSGPAREADATFTARLGAGKLGGRAFDGGALEGRVEGARQVRLDHVELRSGAGTAQGSGTVGMAAPFEWDLEASAAGLPLAALLPGWEGTVSGNAQIGGSFQAPALRFAGNGDAVVVQGLSLGTVQVGGTLRDRRLSVTGSAEGLKLTGQARLEGAEPFEARAEIDLDDVGRLLGAAAPAGLKARVRGEARLQGNLGELDRARVDLTLAELQGGVADFKVQNRDPVQLAIGEGRVELRTVTLLGANTELSLSGSREADGKLSVVAEGAADLRLLGGVVPGVTRPQGRLQIEAHLSGTAAEPLLVGSGRLRDAGFTLRHAPIGVSGLSGDLAFSQNRVIFDHLPATVNGGRADLSGEVELSRPVKVRASATLEGVAPHLPASVDSKVSGQLQMAGTFESMLLSGKLDVVTARYTERVDLDKVDLKKRAAAVKGFDKSGEWLRFDVGLALGDVRVDNDLVRGAVRGDLTVTGSLASLGVVGTLSLAPGAVATFRGHEFQLSHAVVDLTERRRIRAQLDVHGEAQVRDYQVFMHTFGPLDDPQLQLTSQPALTQEDVVTLLSLGVTSRDTAVFAKGEGALAGVGQALLDATGLGDQLKRWLPRDVVQDVNFRLTSAYSEATGQVVPKAEAEARMKVDLDKALSWKLKPFDARLRYQAPLSNTSQGRGQKIQSELKFTDKVSAQLQADNDNVDVGWDLGLDLRLRWESKD